MATEWQAYDVSRLIEDGALLIGDGYRAKNDELSATGVPFARAGNINDGFLFDDADHFPEADLSRLGNKISQPGDVVFTSKGTVGRFAFVREGTARFVYSPQLCFWRSLDVTRIEPRFLFYWMFGREFFVQFKGVAGQTDMAEYVSLGDQRRMRITLPPVSEQRAIAHILGTLDDKIEVNRRMSATLEAMARTIFQDWFVAFGPTRAKMEGRPPYLAPDLWALFPDRLDAEEKPEGWVPRPLSTIAAIGRETVSPASMPDEAFDHYSIPAFDAGRTPVRELGTGILSNKTLVPHGAVLLSKLNPEIPRVWLVDADPSVRSICSTEFLVLSSIEEANRAFLYSVVTDPGFRRRMEAQVTGTSKSHQRVKPQSVLDAEVLLPPPNVLAVFQQRATPLLDRVLANQRESRTLAATRDLLLPRLISGELRVQDAERFVATAT